MQGQTLLDQWRNVRDLALSLRHPTIASNNRISAFLVAFAPASFGSMVSVWYYCAVIWAAISLLIKRYPFRISREGAAVALAISAYPLMLLATALIAGDLPVVKVAYPLTYLVVWLLFVRLLAASADGHLRAMILGAACGCMLALPIAVLQSLFGFRPEGGAGNSDIFASLLIFGATISAFGLRFPGSGMRSLAVAGYICGILAILVAHVRSGIPIVVITSIVAGFFLRRELAELLRVPPKWILISAIGICLVVGFLAVPVIQSGLRELRAIWLVGDYSTSAGHRLLLYRYAAQAILESPLFGYGFHNRMTALLSFAPSEYREALAFTHPHNFVLQAGLDGGIVAVTGLFVTLLGPPVILWRSYGSRNVATQICVCLTVASVGIGMTMLLFGHDIMNSFLLLSWAHLTIMAGGDPEAREAVPGHPSDPHERRQVAAQVT